MTDSLTEGPQETADVPWTAGPWCLIEKMVGPDMGGNHHMQHGVEIRARGVGRRQGHFVTGLGRKNDPAVKEAAANARLIHAAPEMAELVSKLLDALIWCGGSSDFGPEGAAHDGWLKVRPLIAESGDLIARIRGDDAGTLRQGAQND